MYKQKLLELGIPENLKGLEYLNYAIETYRPKQRIMKLYEEIGEQFGAQAISVERCMHRAIRKIDNYIYVREFIAKYKILWSDSND